jgi:hypothetical protein
MQQTFLANRKLLNHKEIFMRGDIVFAREFGGGLKSLRVWESGRKVFYLCSEAVFQRLSSGDEGIPAIGFPKEDVYLVEQSAPLDSALIPYSKVST